MSIVHKTEIGGTTGNYALDVYIKGGTVDGEGLTPFAHETLTVGSTAVGLTSATYSDATRAEMTLETAQIRFWDDGTDPTSSVGIPVYVGDPIVLNSAAQIANFKAIRTGSTSGTLSIQYFH